MKIKSIIVLALVYFISFISCKKEYESRISEVGGRMWIAENPTEFSTGVQNYGAFTNTGSMSNSPVFWKIEKMEFISRDEYNSYGKANLYVKASKDNVTIDDKIEVSSWKWSDDYKTAGPNNDIEAVGQIICTNSNNFNIQVIESKKRSMKVIIEYIIYYNSSSTAVQLYSPILEFKRE